MARPPLSAPGRANRRALVLWAVTALSTTLAGSFHWVGYQFALTGRWPSFFGLETMLGGLLFTLVLHGLILAHEGGHAAALRHYGMRYSGPYFLPAPFLVTGTLGATLRIASSFPSRRALFDVALAGPIVGFVASAAVVGLSIGLSVPVAGDHALARLGQPWLMLAWQKAVWSHQAVVWHPVAIAGWIGLVMTGVNLLPYGPFDGGQMVAALIGPKRAQWVSYACWVPVAWLGSHLLTWAFVGVVMLVVGPHAGPVTLFEPRIGRARVLAFGLAVVLFSVCWLHREPGVTALR